MSEQMLPVLTELMLAPQELSEVIRGNCKQGCSTMRMSKKWSGMFNGMWQCRDVCAKSTQSAVDTDTDEE